MRSSEKTHTCIFYFFLCFLNFLLKPGTVTVPFIPALRGAEAADT